MEPLYLDSRTSAEPRGRVSSQLEVWSPSVRALSRHSRLSCGRGTPLQSVFFSRNKRFVCHTEHDGCVRSTLTFICVEKILCVSSRTVSAGIGQCHSQ